MDPAVRLGREMLGAAVRRARLRHGLSQRQLGWRVALDQTTISRLENGKLKGLRLMLLARVIRTLASGDAFALLDGPPRSTRRLPGERDLC